MSSKELRYPSHVYVEYAIVSIEATEVSAILNIQMRENLISFLYHHHS